MAGSFPSEMPDWSNIDVIHKNTLPPRAYFFLYDDEADALHQNERSRSLCLSGTWKFYHASNPFEIPARFGSRDLDTSSWSNIHVPGHWQLQGFRHPQYVNVQYPFFVDPPHAPFSDNQTGYYATTFSILPAWHQDEIRLRFEGVDSAFHLYVNGQEVGYSQGARNPSEFDITPYITTTGENKLAVKVYQYCDGSYLEDQDQWRMSGIFRDVYLLAIPSVSIQDFHIRTFLDENDERLEFSARLRGSGMVSLKLLDAGGAIVAETTQQTSAETIKGLTLPLSNPHRWTAETPYLYRLVVRFGSTCLVQNVGFRVIEIRQDPHGCRYTINGKRVIFRGVNRHEHHPKFGRAVPYDFMKRDLLIMKQHNINAIRSCHQPSDPRLYALCDELGFYVLDEADLECHGFADLIEIPENLRQATYDDRKVFFEREAARFTTDNPAWVKQYVDRAEQLVMRDRNHPCVVVWSLGNEAFYGCNIQAMYDRIKSIDNSRPVHYEPDTDAKTVDMYSRMYPQLRDVVDLSRRSSSSKPIILCEFAHAMGNGPGAIQEYVEQWYELPNLMGGFVWEWANHGLLHKNESTGQDYFAYGGDFGDIPNDLNFVMDGLCSSEHVPMPGLVEYAKAIEPVKVRYDDAGLCITNRYDFLDLSHLECTIGVTTTDGMQDSHKVPLPIVPARGTAYINIPEVNARYDQETYLQFDFKLAKDTDWAKAGHVIARSQVQLKPPNKASIGDMETELELRTSSNDLYVATTKSTWQVSLSRGMLVSWKKSGVELIADSRGPELTFYRALTDNDRPQDGQEWLEHYVHLMKTQVRKVAWKISQNRKQATVTVEAEIAPPARNWSMSSILTYQFHANGTVKIVGQTEPKGINPPSTLPRVGLTFAISPAFDQATWFGRGPGESYRDKKESQLFGRWSLPINSLWTDYDFPQENGNRTDTRWVTFTSTKSSAESADSHTDTSNFVLTARFGAQPGYSFQATHYETADIDAARHPDELHHARNNKRKDYVIVRLDSEHHGLGTGSCGPKTLDKYALKTAAEHVFEVLLE